MRRLRLSWALAVVLAISAHATVALGDAYTVTANAWSRWDRIERVYVAQRHFIVVMTQLNYAGGTCDGGRQFYVDSASPNYEALSRALLTGFAGRNEVMIVWDGTTIDGSTSMCRGRIDRLQIR